MTPERWKQVDELLNSAMELDPDKRFAFLNEACGEDQELREEVESLLATDEKDQSHVEKYPMQLAADLVAQHHMGLVSGDLVGPYKILSMIGSGGMGEVYLAEDNRLFRKVALKILPSEFTKEPDRLRRFQNEARAASSLNHPNILIVHDIGQMDQIYFIATEYVEGETLRTRLSSGRMSIGEALEITIQTISALASAHEAGIVHRDIKPENIMLRPDGYVKVLDFGLAKVTQPSGSANITEAPTITETGYVLGTVTYMSPEQARGLLVDARSDIFSVGILLYEMITGVTPFQGKTRSDVIAALLERNPLPLSNYSSDVSEEMEWIVNKILQKDREHRYQIARELLNDLRDFKRKLEVSSDLKRSGSAKTRKTFSIRAFEISFRFIFGILAVILLLVLSLYQFKKATGNIDSIAVLPLVNVGKESEMEYLTDGITETIIRSLSELPNLRVMAQSTVFQYKRRDVNPQTVGKDLDVDAVMTGKVIQHGDDLLITIELADARNNSYIWSHQYRGKAFNLLSVQSDIATDISETLGLSPKEEKVFAKHSTRDAEAYQLYLKGRYFWSRRTNEGFEKGISYFRQALDNDPAYALAWAGLADSYLGLAFYEYAAPNEAMPKAKAAIAKALEIDESLAEAHISQAHIAANFDWDWAASEREFKRGIQLNPNYSTGHQWYAIHYLTPMSRFDEAFAELERAQKLDPLSPLMTTFISATLYFARRYEEAATVGQKALQFEPNFPIAHWHLGLVFEQKKMYQQAISEQEKAVALSGGSPRLMAALAHAYAIAGRREEAMHVVKQLNQRDYVSPLELAAIYLALGQKERAFELLEDAQKDRSFHISYLKLRPDFDPIRNDPRFGKLVRRIGLEP